MPCALSKLFQSLASKLNSSHDLVDIFFYQKYFNNQPVNVVFVELATYVNIDLFGILSHTELMLKMRGDWGALVK